MPVDILQITVAALPRHVARCIVKIVNIGGTGAKAGGSVGKDISETQRLDGEKLSTLAVFLKICLNMLYLS